MLFIFNCLLAYAVAAPLRVVLDPGHGGRDQGAVVGSARESDITVDVANHLARELSADPNFRVRLTRDADQRLTLSQRTRVATDFVADVFVSIHVNSSPTTRARGAEFYFQNVLPADEESAFLAHREDELGRGEVDRFAPPPHPALKNLNGELSAIVGDLLDSDRVLRSSRLTKALRAAWAPTPESASPSAGQSAVQSALVRQAPFFVLSKIATPSALVELGFLTNADDRRRLTSATERRAMASDLYRGLQRFRESITQGHASRQP